MLTAIVSVVQSHLPESYKCTADLSDTYNFPSHITPTNLRPDLVLWSDAKRSLCIGELTICFETGFQAAAERKKRRYMDLAEEAARQGYTTIFYRFRWGVEGSLTRVWKTYVAASTPSHQNPGKPSLPI